MKKAYSYIRFSTKEQEKGDSLRRQLDASKKYAEEKGWDLDTNLRDLGQSASYGNHQKRLEEFLKLVEAGEIEKGSVLIVENLDRLSRKKVMDAFDQFRRILKAGIRLVTLSDRQEYTLESVNKNPTQLIISITIMMAAHETIASRTQRKKEKEEQKRVEQDKKHRAPDWLESSKGKKKNEPFKIVQPEAKVKETFVNIFQWKLAQVGNETIVQRLNDDPHSWKPPRNNNWSKSSLINTIRNRAVIGEYWPHKLLRDEEGKPYRERVGDSPIEGYYPPVLDNKQLFKDVQEKLPKNKGGRPEVQNKNLFAGIAKCGLCEGSLHWEGKGNPKEQEKAPNGYDRLRCQNSKEHKPGENHKRICTACGIRYDELEAVVFANLEEVDFNKFKVQAADITKKLQDTQSRLNSIPHDLDEVKKKINSYTFAVGKLDADKPNDQPVIEGHNQMLSRLYKDRAVLKQLQEELPNQIKALKRKADEQGESRDKIMSLRQLMTQAKPEERPLIRQHIQNELQNLIDRILIYPTQGDENNRKKYVRIKLDTGEIRYLWALLDSGEVVTTKSLFLRKVSIRFKPHLRSRMLSLEGASDLLLNIGELKLNKDQSKMLRAQGLVVQDEHERRKDTAIRVVSEQMALTRVAKETLIKVANELQALCEFDPPIQTKGKSQKQLKQIIKEAAAQLSSEDKLSDLATRILNGL